MPKRGEIFQFKQFKVSHINSTMKVGTDAVLLGAWIDITDSISILDVGTGCGVISLMLAQRNSIVRIMAIDIDDSSVKEATKNFINSPWSERLDCLNTSLQEFSSDIKFDHIVSNPPFFLDGTLSPAKSRYAARHTIKLSYNDLLSNTTRLLKSGGKLSIIIPSEQEQMIIAIAKSSGLKVCRLLNFIPKKGMKSERSIITFLKSETEIVTERKEMIHYTEQNQWSEDYINLTRNFYFKL